MTFTTLLLALLGLLALYFLIKTSPAGEAPLAKFIGWVLLAVGVFITLKYFGILQALNTALGAGMVRGAHRGPAMDDNYDEHGQRRDGTDGFGVIIWTVLL